ncbi:MAG: molybdate ABC transporter substrate-binding protein [Verrucomicrobia bacterium]|nr:molybdate ABC transporter substrate-binding protein [Verrucomicrobiota bacterium]
MKLKHFNSFLTSVLAFASLITSSPAEDKSLLLCAAASTTDFVQDVADAYTEQTGEKVRLNLASSSLLARQIAQGAPADIFLSANLQWMDYLEERGLTLPETRVDFLSNALVLIAPVESRIEVKISADVDPSELFEGYMALGDPAHVPAGRYAAQALGSLGWAEKLEGRLLPCLDVRAALATVERGEAQLGIVYKTDAAISEKVRVVAVFPPELHDPIRYSVACCRPSRPGAKRLLDFMVSPAAAKLAEALGFVSVEQ